MEIGKKIKELRVLKNITQEELAKELFVSTQAVSKWENGGSPDIELVPTIAKYFDVTTDYLFDIESSDFKNIEKNLCKYLESINTEEERFYKMHEIGYYMMISYFNCDNIDEYDYKKILNEGKDGPFSQVQTHAGVALTSLYKDKPFFAVFPRPIKGNYNKAIENKKLQIEFAKNLSDEDFYNALVLINTRENTSFTEDLFVKQLNMTHSKALEIISELLKFKLLSQNTLELNGENIKTYLLKENNAIVGLFYFLDLMVKKPNAFSFSLTNSNGKYFK